MKIGCKTKVFGSFYWLIPLYAIHSDYFLWHVLSGCRVHHRGSGSTSWPGAGATERWTIQPLDSWFKQSVNRGRSSRVYLLIWYRVFAAKKKLNKWRCTYVFLFEYDTRGKYENHNLYFVTDPLYTIYRYYPVLFLDLSRGRGGEWLKHPLESTFIETVCIDTFLSLSFFSLQFALGKPALDLFKLTGIRLIFETDRNRNRNLPF